MKISVISDCHLGLSHNSNLEDDSFDNMKEAIENSLDCDLILCAGDMFDSRYPRTNTWAKAISILTKPLIEKSGINFISSTKNLKKIHERTLNSIPFISLHGNHDRILANEKNVIQALDQAGILIHLDKENIVFEKNGVKVAIHGMSSVPERYSKSTLQLWNPKPIFDSFNILMIHQNIDKYVYSPLEIVDLKIENFPKGFDVILNGHIHNKIIDKIGESIFIILGSTVTTQFNENESKSVKGFHKINFENSKSPQVEFIPINSNRKFFYYEIKNNNSEIIRKELDILFTNIVNKNFLKKPVVKVKIFGKDTDFIDHYIAVFNKKYSDKLLLNFVKKLESVEITEKMEFMKTLREQRLSVEEIGINLLKNNLDELKFSLNFNFQQLFELMINGEIDKTISILSGNQKTLHDVGGKLL